ncbi:hypothetical protein FH5_00157 [Priestia endophytica]|nr:hypothetical protein FH5_00157 [Priestia endophytica]
MMMPYSFLLKAIKAVHGSSTFRASRLSDGTSIFELIKVPLGLKKATA